MTLTTLILSAFVLLILLATLLGVFWKRRTVAFAFLGLVTFGIGCLGAWYAAMETGSLSWTIGYGLLATCGLISLIRHQKLVVPKS